MNWANFTCAAEKEKQRAEKAKKLADKQAKQQAAAAAASRKPKTIRETTSLPKYVDSTPEGLKKRVSMFSLCHCVAIVLAQD